MACWQCLPQVAGQRKPSIADKLVIVARSKTDPHGAAKRLDNVIDQIESSVIPKERICNLLYRDLVTNPIETAAKVHDYFHLPFSAETRAAVERDRPAFKRYQEYFGVPDEN